MDLSLREAATLIGRSPRTLRAQLVRGEITGRKDAHGRWLVDRRSLPMTESQRAALQSRCDVHAPRSTVPPADCCTGAHP